MKKLLLAIALATALSPAQAASESEGHTISVISGGWSQHWGSQWRDWYEEDNKAFGLMLDNKYMITTFTNSFHRKSVAVAYNWTLASTQIGDFSLSGGVLLGLVHGYKDEDLEFGYIGNGVSLYTLPNAQIKYQITKDFSVGLDVGLIFHPEGVGTTETINLTYRF